MGLFHVIKYGLSEPPTEDELSAIPPHLLERFKSRAGFADDHTPSSISATFRLYTYESATDIKLLRRLIQEYEE